MVVIARPGLQIRCMFSAFSLILGSEHLDMRLSRVKGVWGGDEDWGDPDAGDEVESGELGARPPFNFATL